MALTLDSLTVLLLHGNGANGSTTFTDETGKTVTTYGNPQISTAQSKFGGSSMSFDGIGDYLSIPSHPAFDQNIDFTAELFVYQTALNGVYTLYLGQPYVNYMSIGADTASGKYVLNLWGYGNKTYSSTSIQLNTWVHLAMVKISNVFYLYVNGVLEGTPYAYTGTASLGAFVIGGESSNQYVLNGFIDDFRITNGHPIYTANFTPPTAPLEIIPGTPVSIKYQDTGTFAPGNYNPAVGSPKVIHQDTDLTDALPYGILKGSVNNPVANPDPWEFKGRGLITGTVKITPATPARRLVKLYREPEGVLVKSTWSDAVTGAYEFRGVREGQTYTVISYDHTGSYGAVIADKLVPTTL